MRRPWNTQRIPQHEGSDRSMQLATALAQTCDPEFLESVLHVKGLLDRIGGQVYVAAYRQKFDAQGNKLDDPKQPGDYFTLGYLFHYEHLAKLNRQDVEPDVPVGTADPLTIPEPTELVHLHADTNENGELVADPDPEPVPA